jgi:C1A family cysteine protease
VRAFLAAGIPVAFGFCLPSSLSAASDIPYRPTFDSYAGGHAALAVGYDDRRLHAGKGSLLIRSSWGESWGEKGYGWLPYAFVEQQLATDFWTILKAEWLCSGEFQQPLTGQLHRHNSVTVRRSRPR